MTALHKLSKDQFGDTIVEVMLATVIMSVVVASSFALVNRASRLNQVSSERSEVANAMQYQAEALRFYRDGSMSADSKDSKWTNDIVPAIDSGVAGSNNNCTGYLSGESDKLSGGNSFYFDKDLNRTSFASVKDAPNISERYFVWIEGFKSTEYIDFYVHSCWMGPGGTGPQQASLIYRLTI